VVGPEQLDVDSHDDGERGERQQRDDPLIARRQDPNQIRAVEEAISDAATINTRGFNSKLCYQFPSSVSRQ